MASLYHGYDFTHKTNYCVDCHQPVGNTIYTICDDCNELRKLVMEDREIDELEKRAEDERDHRKTIQSILNDMHPY